MYPFFETIALLNGIPRNLPFHQNRLDSTYHFHYKRPCPYKLDTMLHEIETEQGIRQRWKFLYNEDHYSHQINLFQPVYPNSFVLTPIEFEYPFKYSDRHLFEQLKNQLPYTTEPVLMVNNYITDTTYSNLVFYKNGYWITPKHPLLKGTMRQSLLSSGNILEGYITREDLHLYPYFKCINALYNFDEARLYSTHHIKGCN